MRFLRLLGGVGLLAAVTPALADDRIAIFHTGFVPAGPSGQMRPLVKPPAGTLTLKHPGFVAAAVHTPDGRLVTAAADGVIRVWDPATGKELKQLRGHTGPVLSLSLARDGRTLASGGDDRTIRIWDLRGGKELRRLEGHRGGIETLTISPDGKLLLSADNGTSGVFRSNLGLAAT